MGDGAREELPPALPLVEPGGASLWELGPACEEELKEDEVKVSVERHLKAIQLAIHAKLPIYSHSLCPADATRYPASLDIFMSRYGD